MQLLLETVALPMDATAFGIHDRAYSYDHAGRLKEAYSGREANQFRTGTGAGVEGAYRQSYTYDAFDNTKARAGRFWTLGDNSTEAYDLKGRNTAWEYDADGRFISRNEAAPNALPYTPLRNTYDAAGRLTQTTQTTTWQDTVNPNHVETRQVTRAKGYDGDGMVVKEDGTYYLRSSVLGGRVVSEYEALGVRRVTHVLAGGEAIADSWQNGATRVVNWRHTNPVTGDAMDTDSAGEVVGKATIDP